VARAGCGSSAQIRDTVDFVTLACSPSASVSVASTSRTDWPRTDEAITSAFKAFVRSTPVPNSCKANRLVVPRSFGRSNVTGP